MALNRWQDAVLSLFTEIARIEPRIESRISNSRPAGLTENSFVILNHLGRVANGGDTRGGLSWTLESLDGDMDAELEPLIAAGLVEIAAGAGPAADQLTLTPEGLRTYEAAVVALSPEFEQIMAGIDIESIESAMTTLREIRRTLDNLPDR
jgi:hypothetical protein